MATLKFKISDDINVTLTVHSIGMDLEEGADNRLHYYLRLPQNGVKLIERNDETFLVFGQAALEGKAELAPETPTP